MLVLGLAVGCSAGAADGEETAGAVESSAQLTRLATATVSDVLKQHDTFIENAISICQKAHADVTEVSAQNTSSFTQTDNFNPAYDHLGFAIDLGDMFRSGGPQIIPVANLARALHDWAKSKLDTTVGADGDVDDTKFRGLKIYGGIYSAYEKSLEDNALTRAAAPTGIDLRAVRAEWDKVRVGSTLDSRFLLPVAVGGEPSLGDVRKAYAGGANFMSWGDDAVRDFASASEGPKGDPAFQPIADAVSGRGIVKRWYFTDGGSSWSTNILIVLDDKNQLWGFQMGYSE